MSEHGPWLVWKFRDGHAIIYDDDWAAVAKVYAGETTERRARIIAAAPDLLEAVICLMDQSTMSPIEMTPEQRKALWASHGKAHAAIDKAIG